MFICQFCTRPYTRRKNLNAHLRTVHANEQKNEVEKNAKRKNNDDGGGEVAAKKVKIAENKFKCRYCENTYAKKYSRDLHQRATHEGDVIRATPIEFIGGGGEQRRTHFQQVRNILSRQRPEKPEKDDKAKKSIVIYKFKNINPANIRQLPNINTQLQEIKEKFFNAILDESQQHSQGIKYMTVMELVFKRLTLDKQQYEWMHQPAIYNSKMQELVYGTSKDEIIDRMQDFTQKFWNYVDEFQSVGSGWILSYVKQANLKIFDFALIRGGKYLPLPDKIKNKQACINVQNDDEKCFKWAILAALHNKDIDKDHDRVTKYYPYQGELNEEGLTYPVDPMNKKMLKKFEDNNGLLINIWGLTEKNEVAVYRSARIDRQCEEDVEEEERTEIVLLLVINEDGDSHYVYVKDISRLLKGREGHRDHRKLYYCLSCLSHKSSQEKLDEHKKICNKKGSVAFPKESTMKFENFKNMWRLPFVVYADFECIVEKADNIDEDADDGKNSHFCLLLHNFYIL